MTKETKVLHTTQFMSLEQDSKEWANSIMQLSNNYHRCDTSKEIANNGFSIKDETSSLEKYYLRK